MGSCTGNTPTGYPMGFQFGLDDPGTVVKRKFRWLFQLAGVSAYNLPMMTNALPPRRGARPGLTWKEYECQHINETIHYPFKPDWKPVQLQLFDIGCNRNPVFDWICFTQNFNSGGMYDPRCSWNPIVDVGFKRTAALLMLDGCGGIVEQWTFENCYPQNIEWGELDMDSNDVVTVDLTLRYDRAYIGPFQQCKTAPVSVAPPVAPPGFAPPGFAPPVAPPGFAIRSAT